MIRTSLVLLLLLLACGVGCRSSKPLPRADAQVYLLRGHQDWYSAGIDQLGERLRAVGCDAVVLPQADSGALGEALAAHHDQSPLVLIGFSFGADDALRVAHRIEKINRKVDLLITIDPVTPPRVPANVVACVNYYQSNGVMDLFPWLRGVPVAAERGAAKPTNFNLRTDRTDLLQPDTSHATIAGHAKLHQEIVTRVVGVVAPVSTLSASKP